MKQYLSVITEICLGVAMSINENQLDRELLLQYFTEEQLEWLARSEVAKSVLNISILSGVLKYMENFIDIIISKKIFDWEEFKQDVYKRNGALLS